MSAVGSCAVLVSCDQCIVRVLSTGADCLGGNNGNCADCAEIYQRKEITVKTTHFVSQLRAEKVTTLRSGEEYSGLRKWQH